MENDCKQILEYTFRYCFFFNSKKVLKDFNLQTEKETQCASHSGPIPPESSSYLLGRQMSCLQWQGLERAPHHSHSDLTQSLHLRLCVHVCALLLEYAMRVCKSSARSRVVAYVNPRSFAPFFIYPSSSTSSSAICAVSSHLPQPWHLPSTFKCLPERSEGKRRDAPTMTQNHMRKTFFFQSYTAILQFTTSSLPFLWSEVGSISFP